MSGAAAMTDIPQLASTLEEVVELVGPDTVALQTPKGGGATASSLSYGRLLRDSSSLADGLHEHGVRPGDVVAVWMPNVPEWAVIELAAARLGCQIVPINTRYKASEAEAILRGSEASTVVAATGFYGLDLLGYLREACGWDSVRPDVWSARIPGVARVIVFDVSRGSAETEPGTIAFPALLEGDRSGRPIEPVAPEAPLNLFPTSGSSGAPKIAVHAQRSVVLRARAARVRLDVHPGDNVLCALPLCGVWGMMLTLTALVGGAKCTLLPVFDGDIAAALIASEGVTHFHGGDDMVRAVLDSPKFDPERSGRWRVGHFGNFSGRPVDDIVDRGDAYGIGLGNAYGSSEGLALCLVNRADADRDLRLLGGGPLVDELTRARIVDPETGAPCETGKTGELQLFGPIVMLGYRNNDQANAAAFTDDGWYRSGDLCFQTAAGEIYFVSRLKDTMRLRGYLVDGREIEEHLLADPRVHEAHVVGLVAPEGGDRAVAFVTLIPSSEADEASLKDACKQRVASYKVPSRIVVIDDMPLLSGTNGAKVDVVTLRGIAQTLDRLDRDG